MKKFLILLITSFSCLYSSEIDDTVYSLEDYIVVATRTPLQLDRVSPSVSFISIDEIESWQDRSLSDALIREAGMVTVSSGAKGTQSSLFTRGSNSDHTTFFWDGRRLNTGIGNQYGLERLSLNNIGNVQVQKGASSVNYGSSGIGGIVELRSQSAFRPGVEYSDFYLESGSNEYIAHSFSTAFREDNLGVSVTTSKISTENERLNDAYVNESISSRIDYLLTDNLSLEVIGRYDETDKELAGSIYSPTLHDNQQTTDWLISPGIWYKTSNLTLHLFYAASESIINANELNSAYDSSWNYVGEIPVSNQIKVDSDEIGLQVDYDINDSLLFTTGAVYRNDYASNSNMNTWAPLSEPVPYGEKFEQTGIFTQALFVIKNLEIRAGTRLDKYSDFDNQVTGHIEGVYNLPNTNLTLFGKIASSYAPPGASDIAYDSDTSTPLQPEKSDSYEIGLNHTTLDGNLESSLLFFRNNIDNLLGYDPLTYDTYNVDSAMTSGIEYNVNYAVTSKINLAAAYTYLTAIDNNTKERLLRRPRHMVQLSANYQITDSINTGIQGIGYFDREDINAATYTRIDHEDLVNVNLVANWKVNNGLTIFTRVENLLDELQEPIHGYPSLGRATYIGAKFSF